MLAGFRTRLHQIGFRQIAAGVRYVPSPGAVGSVSKGEGQSRQTDQVEIPFQAATFGSVRTQGFPGTEAS